MTDAEWRHASWYVIYPVALLPHLDAQGPVTVLAGVVLLASPA
jgi:hypothetical protein